MSKRILIISTVLVALLQTCVLAKIVTDRAVALNAGQEVILETGFVDPRDLFRGHYTVLNFEIESIDKSTVEIVGDYTYSTPIYIELDTSGDFAQAKRLTPTPPTDATGPVLMATVRNVGSNENTPLTLNLPFERFYAAKTRALKLQNMQRERKLGVILSVADDGTAMIKGLTIEGEKIYEEPLY
jgi:uncharacterized membrane-anchored protein